MMLSLISLSYRLRWRLDRPFLSQESGRRREKYGEMNIDASEGGMIVQLQPIRPKQTKVDI